MSVGKWQSERPQIHTEIPKPIVELEDLEPWLVKTTHRIRVPPRVKQMILGRVELPRRQEAPPLVLVEPALLPNEGVLAARELSPVLPSADLMATLYDVTRYTLGTADQLSPRICPCNGG